MKIISGKIKRAQKVVIYGPEGIGKTTLASKFPDPLFIDTESGTCHLDVKRFESIKSFSDLMDAVTYVGQNPDVCQTLIIDTMDWAEELIIKQVLKEEGWKNIGEPGYGLGYVALENKVNLFLSYLSRLIELGINVVLTAHAMMRKFEEPGNKGAYDRWELKMAKKTSPVVKEWADTVLFINYETFVVKDGKAAKGKVTGTGRRVIYTSHKPEFDAKNRWGLPEEIEAEIEPILPHLLLKEEPKKEPVKTKAKAKAETAEEEGEK